MGKKISKRETGEFYTAFFRPISDRASHTDDSPSVTPCLHRQVHQAPWLTDAGSCRSIKV